MPSVVSRVARTIRHRMFNGVPKLPDAAGDRGRTAVGAEPAIRLALLGDSSAAGVGAATHDEALAGRLAGTLAGLTGRAVSWRVVAETGATTDRVAGTLTRDLTVPVEGWRPDIVVVTTGVNDLLRWRPLATWRANLTELFRQVRHRCPEAGVVVSGLPPVGTFPLLPTAFRRAVAWRVKRMDRVLAELAERTGHRHVPLGGASDGQWFSQDGFHLAPAGYRAWARVLALAAADTLDGRPHPHQPVSSRT